MRVWNYGTFPGAAMDDPDVYGQRVSLIFGAARHSPYYTKSGFDLVMGAQAVNVYRTGQQLKSAENFDSVSVAPYLFNSFQDGSSEEAIFGPMFAQPESVDSVDTGYMQQQSKAVSAAGKRLVVYEVNVSPLSGHVPQEVLTGAASSLGAGLAVVDHMLLMMRDLGIKSQSVWELSGFSNHCENPDVPERECASVWDRGRHGRGN